MKKALSVLVALTMLAALCVPAFAADIVADGTGDTIIKTSTLKDTNDDGVGDTDAEGFKVTIPADTLIPWGTEATDVSYMVEAHLARGKAVSVAVTGNGTMKTADAVYEIPYTLNGTTNFVAANPWVYDTVTDTGVIQPLTVQIAADDWNTAVVEAYQDTLTYTVSVVTV